MSQRSLRKPSKTALSGKGITNPTVPRNSFFKYNLLHTTKDNQARERDTAKAGKTGRTKSKQLWQENRAPKDNWYHQLAYIAQGRISEAWKFL